MVGKDAMVGVENAYVSAAVSALGEIGFHVRGDATIEGLSGLKHSFDIVAQRLDRLVCLSVKQPTPTALLIEMAKSLDVREEVIVAVIGDAPQGLAPGVNGKRFKVVPVNSPEELASKLKDLLAETDPPR